MPRSAKTIDAGNVLPVCRYLLTALRDPRRSYRFDFSGEKREQALAELEALIPGGIGGGSVNR